MSSSSGPAGGPAIRVPRAPRPGWRGRVWRGVQGPGGGELPAGPREAGPRPAGQGRRGLRGLEAGGLGEVVLGGSEGFLGVGPPRVWAQEARAAKEGSPEVCGGDGIPFWVQKNRRLEKFFTSY